MGSCPWDIGEDKVSSWFRVGICARLCVYAFGTVRIVIRDVGGCHMSILINPG